MTQSIETAQPKTLFFIEESRHSPIEQEVQEAANGVIASTQEPFRLQSESFEENPLQQQVGPAETEIVERIKRENLTIQSPSMVIQAVFDQIPDTWFFSSVDLWPPIIPEEWKATLKTALLSEPEFESADHQKLIYNAYNTIKREALDFELRIINVCLQAIFAYIPEEWMLKENLENWPQQVPDSWQEPIKHALLNNTALRDGIDFPEVKINQSLIREDLLNEGILSSWIDQAYDIIKEPIKEWSLNPQTQNLVRKAKELAIHKETFNIETACRINVERNPRVWQTMGELNKTTFAKFLSHFNTLVNGVYVDMKRIERYISFLIAISHDEYPSLYSLNVSDRLAVFLIQLEGNFSQEVFNEILEECQKDDLIDKLDVTLTDLPTNGTSLSQFILHLSRITAQLNPDSFQTFIETLTFYSLDYQLDHPPPPFTCDWLQCGDLVYGFEPWLDMLPQSEEIYQTLDVLPRLTPHNRAIDRLVRKYLGQSNSFKVWLAQSMYKCWWYGHCPKGPRKEALSDRVIDWYMHDYLVTNGYWDSTCEDAVQIVEAYFREKTSLLPFNQVRAERAYFSLQEEYAGIHIDELMENSLKENKDITLSEAIKEAKAKFKNLHLKAPFDRARAERTYVLRQDQNRGKSSVNQMEETFQLLLSRQFTEAESKRIDIVEMARAYLRDVAPTLSFDHEQAKQLYRVCKEKQEKEFEMYIKRFCAKNDGIWDLSFADAIEKIKFHLRSIDPPLPFNSKHAKHVYACLKKERWNKKIDALIKENLLAFNSYVS